MSMVQSGFNYSALAPETRLLVEAATDRLHVLERKTGEQIIEIGRTLIKVKDSLPHGHFGSWIESEFGWSLRTAGNFMAVAERFKSAKFADLDIAPSALYALASGTTPEEVREEFIKRAESGERITHKDVKQGFAVIDLDTGEIESPAQATERNRIYAELRKQPDGEQLIGHIENGDWDLDDARDELRSRREESITTDGHPRPSQLPSMPSVTKPTPIYDTPRGMSGIDAASAIIGLRRIPTADVSDAGYYLVDMERDDLDGLISSLPSIYRAIDRIKDRAIQVRLKQDKVG